MAGKNFDISKFAGTLQSVSDSDTMMEIEVDKIVKNPRNFYPAPTYDQLEALMDSIAANGLLEPPTVTPDGEGRYRLISGHSRMRAVRELRQKDSVSGGHRWDKVVCRVLPPMDDDTETTAVIEANRQRVKTQALLASEAERLTELYIRRRENGEKLPGRIRDRVAAALEVNRTKLANLSAIKNGLKVPGIMERWERDEIPEAAALMIARMDQEAQYRLLDWMIDKGCSYSIREVRKFEIIWGGVKHECPETGRLCPNASAMYDACYRGGEWHCAGCCQACRMQRICKAACQYAKETAEQPEAEPAAEEQMAAADLQEVQEAPRPPQGWFGPETLPEVGQQIILVLEDGYAEEAEFEELFETSSGAQWDQVVYWTGNPLYADAAAELPECQMMIAGWMPGGVNPAEPGDFAVLIDRGDWMMRDFYRWDGNKWEWWSMKGNVVRSENPPAWYMRLPPIPESGGAK